MFSNLKSAMGHEIDEMETFIWGSKNLMSQSPVRAQPL